MDMFAWLSRPAVAPHLLRGRRAERRARLFLQSRGLRTVARNYRCRGGEIDLVMRDRNQLVFVEVRCRASQSFVAPEETVNAAKQSRLRHAAAMFLSRHRRYRALPCRFDVLALHDPDRGAQERRWRWLRERILSPRYLR